MSKYINRKKLLKEIDKRTKKMIPDQYDGRHYLSIEAMREIIANFDTVDVKPVIVIHAKWEPDEESSVEKPCYRCSNCEAVLEEDYNWHNHNFCYHCGAKMDGEENENRRGE